MSDITVSESNMAIELTPTEGEIVFEELTIDETISVNGTDIDIEMRGAGCPAIYGNLNIGMKSSRGIRVLWDMSHSTNPVRGPSGWWSVLKAAITYDLFEETYTGFLVEDLSRFSILVVNAVSCQSSQYTVEEVAAIVAFVEDGGGLLIQGEYHTLLGIDNIKPVATAFGVTIGINTLGNIVIDDFTPHPIFDNVSGIYVVNPGAISAVSPSSVFAREPTGDGMVTVGEPGGGKVVVIGDGNWDYQFNATSTNYLSMSDNFQFAQNVFEWLAG